jgi:hypothetical protein
MNHELKKMKYDIYRAQAIDAIAVQAGSSTGSGC